RINGFVVGVGLLGELQEESASGGEVGMGAFVERALLVRDAAGNKPPETGERLEVQVVLQPPGREVESGSRAGESADHGQIVADHPHLAVRETGIETPSGGGPLRVDIRCAWLGDAASMARAARRASRGPFTKGLPMARAQQDSSVQNDRSIWRARAEPH